MPVKDDSFFFPSGPRRLFATWQGTERAPRAVVVYCHPFGEEKKSSHRAVVECARALANEGVASLRFDLSGCGDSEGEFDQARFGQWYEDVAAAWQEAGRRAPGAPRALLGLRLGATLAVESLELLSDVHALILWQPVLNGKEEFDVDLRRLLIQEMMTHGRSGGERREMMAAFERGERELELDGYSISRALYQEIAGLQVARRRAQFPKRAGILQFARRMPRIESFAKNEPAIETRLIEMPPVWSRTDYIPSPEDGLRLAREGVLPWLS